MDMEAESLDGRLVRYTAEIVALSGRMPSGQAAQEVATGLLQAVMGLLPRYHAACEMVSDRAFSRKLRQCRRMLRDALVWLSVIEKSGLLPHDKIQGMHGDTVAMEAIFSRIIHEIERRLV